MKTFQIFLNFGFFKGVLLDIFELKVVLRKLETQFNIYLYIQDYPGKKLSHSDTMGFING
jgi:hypothetical protein